VETNKRCPCGSTSSLDDCCGRFITGQAVPDTAEELMRSRYTAFATGAVDYIVETHHPETRGELDHDEVEQYSRSVRWLGLDVVDTQEGKAGDDQGWVEFFARYTQGGQEKLHHERSLFRRERGRWFFHSPHEPVHTPVRAEPKTGRNAPCPCGSGKKYKKCCGAST
jgi:SEC-C motif domain protein